MLRKCHSSNHPQHIASATSVSCFRPKTPQEVTRNEASHPLGDRWLDGRGAGLRPSLAADLPRPAYKAPVYVAPPSSAGPASTSVSTAATAGATATGTTAVARQRQLQRRRAAWSAARSATTCRPATSSSVWKATSTPAGSTARVRRRAGAPCASPAAKPRTPGSAPAAAASATPGIASCPTSRAARRSATSRRRAANGGSVDKTKLGWTVGGGVEWAFMSATGRRRSNISTPISATSPATRRPAAAARTPRSRWQDATWSVVGVNYRF